MFNPFISHFTEDLRFEYQNLQEDHVIMYLRREMKQKQNYERSGLT